MRVSSPKREMPISREITEQPDTIIRLYSDGFQAISEWFKANHSPYSHHDIIRFNALYQRYYSLLSVEEKRRIEEWVDTLIEGVEDRKLISKIFGVV